MDWDPDRNERVGLFGQDQSGVGAALCRAHSKTPSVFRRHAVESIPMADTNPLAQGSRVAKRLSEDASPYRHSNGRGGKVARTVPVSEGGFGSRVAKRLSWDASPYRHSNGRGGKGGANRPGERSQRFALQGPAAHRGRFAPPPNMLASIAVLPGTLLHPMEERTKYCHRRSILACAAPAPGRTEFPS